MNVHSLKSHLQSETCKKILSSASACFSEKGFRATSIGDIARRAGISQGAMYTYFRGKDDLIVAIVSEEAECALTVYSAPYTCSSLERICQIARSCIMKSGYPVNPSLWTEIIAESARNEAVKRCFLSADTAMRDALKKVIQAGIESGEFENVDAEEASILLFAILDGLIARRAIDAEFNVDQRLPSFQRSIENILNL